MTKRSVSSSSHPVKHFFRVWKHLNILGRLKRSDIERRGKAAHTIVLFVILGLWMQSSSINRMPNSVLVAEEEVASWTVYRFLRDRRFDLRKVLYSFVSHSNTFEEDLLIIDDTDLEGTGEKTEGVSFHYSSGKKRRVLGHGLVILYHRGTFLRQSIDFELKVGKVKPKGIKGKRRKPTPELIRAKSLTKIQLALEMIKRTLALGNRARTVVFDCWYYALWFVKALSGLGLHWVTRYKMNYTLIVEGKRCKAKEIVDSIRSYKRYKDQDILYAQKEAFLKGFGPVKAVVVLFYQKGKKGRQKALLITDNLQLSAAKVIQIYLKRGDIEPFIKEEKQLYGLENAHLQSLHSISNYIALCMLAHLVGYVIQREDRSQDSLYTVVFNFFFFVLCFWADLRSLRKRGGLRTRFSTGFIKHGWPKNIVVMRL